MHWHFAEERSAAEKRRQPDGIPERRHCCHQSEDVWPQKDQLRDSSWPAGRAAAVVAGAHREVGAEHKAAEEALAVDIGAVDLPLGTDCFAVGVFGAEDTDSVAALGSMVLGRHVAAAEGRVVRMADFADLVG